MKTVFFSLIMLCAVCSSAQTSSIDSLQDSYKNNRALGIAMVSLGTASSVAGAVFMALSDPTAKPPTLFIISATMLATGAAELGIGIYCLLTADKQKEALIKLRSGAAMHISYPVPVMVAGRAPGIGFSVRF